MSERFVKVIDENKQLKTVLERLENSGYSAYLVGGAVRDILMGKTPTDFDVCTSAKPTEVERVFSAEKIIETGLKHGTVTIGIDGKFFEITTFRIDGEYKDNRKPATVEFSVDIDLSRRDFTVNAMAYSLKTGFLDLYNGAKDLEDKTIRAVGNPNLRMREDALRILRGIRFCSKLGFNAEPLTKKSFFDNKMLLKKLSAERIREELNGIILGVNAKTVMNEYAEIIFEILPELKPCYKFNQRNPHHIYDVYEHTLTVVENAEMTVKARLAALLHDSGKPCCFSLDEKGVGHFYSHPKESVVIANKVLLRLKYDKKTIAEVLTLVEHHDLRIPLTETAVKRWLNKLGEETFFDLLKLKRADCMGQNYLLYPERLKELEILEAIAHKVIFEKQCFSLKSLKINGNDVKQAGFSGARIGEVLNEVFEKVINGELPNDEKELKEYLDKISRN